MMYEFAHYLKDKMPCLWEFIENINSFLFSYRYGNRLESFNCKIPHDGFVLKSLKDVTTDKLVDFFAYQPEDAFLYFRPHAFDAKTILKLQNNKAFLAYVLIDENNDKIAGYCFIRSFFHGKGFRGRMVDIDYRGRGIGTLMNKILNETGFNLGLRLFETVSKNNIASYRSAINASKIRVVKEFPNNDLYIEICS